jgi:hypothetical protein
MREYRNDFGQPTDASLPTRSFDVGNWEVAFAPRPYTPTRGNR